MGSLGRQGCTLRENTVGYKLWPTPDNGCTGHRIAGEAKRKTQHRARVPVVGCQGVRYTLYQRRGRFPSLPHVARTHDKLERPTVLTTATFRDHYTLLTHIYCMHWLACTQHSAVLPACTYLTDTLFGILQDNVQKLQDFYRSYKPPRISTLDTQATAKVSLWF
jgi:hypothetical protein